MREEGSPAGRDEPADPAAPSDPADLAGPDREDPAAAAPETAAVPQAPASPEAPASSAPSDPAASESSGAGASQTAESSGTDRSATESSATDGSATDGSATDGSATDGSATDGSGTDRSGTESSGTDGSATDRSGTEADASETPVTDTADPDRADRPPGAGSAAGAIGLGLVRRPPEMYLGAVFLTVAALPLVVVGGLLTTLLGAVGANLRRRITEGWPSVDPETVLLLVRIGGALLLLYGVVYLGLTWFAVRPRRWARAGAAICAAGEVALLVVAMVLSATDPVSVGVILLAAAGAVLLYLPRCEEYLVAHSWAASQALLGNREPARARAGDPGPSDTVES